jgi:Mce-associated membrane protein
VTTEANAENADVDVTTADEPESTAAEPASAAVEESSASDEDATSEAERGSDEEPTSEADDVTKRGRLPGLRKRLGVIVLTVLLLASAGVAAWLYFFEYRVDQQTDAGARGVAIDAAKGATVALLSYSPETLDKDFAAAKSHLTGDFLNYYTQFTEQIVTPAAKQKQVKTSAAVVESAVAELKPDSAVVLVFVNQNTTSKENPEGAFAASAVKVGMTKVDGHWLINAFDPV